MDFKLLDNKLQQTKLIDINFVQSTLFTTHYLFVIMWPYLLVVAIGR